ncbi:MAG: O-antigen ligase family protein [Deltaproteobacteria bacterium]|nr:O-antigen ligase family protein [Deltaproteobacteria bacterium]
MNLLAIALYLTSSIIRPADWVGPLRGVPIDVFIAAGFCILLSVTGKISIFFKQLRRREVQFVLLSFAVSMMATLLGGDMEIFLAQAYFYGKMIFFYLTLLVFTSTEKRSSGALAIFVALVGIVAYQGIIQYTTGIGWATNVHSWAGKIPRAKWVGMYDGPNVYCILLNIGFAFALQFLLGPSGRVLRVLSLLASAMIVPAIYYSNSRGGFLAFLAIIAMTLWLRSQKANQRIEIRRLVAVCAILGVLMVVGPSRMGEIKDSEGSSAGRIDAWYEGILMLKESPLFGVGLGNWTKHHHLIAHNNFVQNMGEVGIIGLFFWLLMVYAHVVSLFRSLIVTTDPRARRTIVALLAGLGGMVISSSFLSTNEFDLWYVLFAFSGAFLFQNRHEVRMTIHDLRNVFLIEVFGILLISGTIRLFYA